MLGHAEQKLFFILPYFKAYRTQYVMGLLFGITQCQVSEWVRQLTSVTGQLIPLHRPARQARDLNQLLRDQPELEELIIDGTERRLSRPQHRGKQKRFYSRRKKRHAVKNVLIVGQRRVLWCSPTVPGKCHDKKVVSERDCTSLRRFTFWATVPLKALEAGAAGVVTPWTRRNRNASHWRHRRFNRLLAAHRIPVEHTLASVKRLRILQDEFRNRRDEVMAIGCTLHNFRCERRQWAIAE